VARQQLKWFAAAGVFAGFTLLGPGTLLNYLVSGDPTQSRIKATEILTIFAIGTIPVATGVAILRYRLYDIDRILSRTVAWAGIMVVLVATFVGLVIGLQALLEPITGGGTLAVAGSTLVVAAATQPLARRVQAGVDRRFFRGRYDAARTVDSFAGRLRSEVDLQSIEHDVHATLSGTVNPVHVAVWIRAAKDRWSMAAPDLEAVRSPDGAVDMSRNVPDATERPVS